MKNKNRAFTLIELLIVIAIIGVLIALLAPAVAKTREQSQTAACVNNVRQLGLAMSMYADDHNSAIPDVPDTANYVENTENVYKCPRDTRLGIGLITPSYTAWQGTPNSLLSANIHDTPSQTAVYVETDKAGTDKSDIAKEDILFRHGNRTVIVWADGRATSHDQSQMATLILPMEDAIPVD